MRSNRMAFIIGLFIGGIAGAVIYSYFIIGR